VAPVLISWRRRALDLLGRLGPERLEAAEPPRDLVARRGELVLELELPMPGVALLSLTPA
jgi:hypothetical protein